MITVQFAEATRMLQEVTADLRDLREHAERIEQRLDRLEQATATSRPPS